MRAVLAALLLLVPPAAAETFRLVHRVGIEAGNQLGGHLEGHAGPLYAGIRAATSADPQRIGRYELYLGLKPTLADGRLDLRLSQPMDGTARLGLDFDHELGRDAGFTARLDLDPVAATASGEAGASVALSPRTRIGAAISGRLAERVEQARLRLTARRSFEDGALAITLTQATNAPVRADLSLSLRF